jgi:hypothetical protein
MHRVGFEPTIPVFERAEAFCALDRAATVIASLMFYSGDSDQKCVHGI